MAYFEKTSGHVCAHIVNLSAPPPTSGVYVIQVLMKEKQTNKQVFLKYPPHS